jgi:hypothetical protein
MIAAWGLNLDPEINKRGQKHRAGMDVGSET